MTRSPIQPTWRTALGPYLLVGVLWLAYAALSIWTPTTASNPNPYHLTTLTKDLLVLTIVIPMLVIWLVAVRGALAFQRYARLIKGSPEAPALTLIAQGLMWLVGFMIVFILVGAITPHLTKESWFPAVVVIRNHLPAYVALVSATLLYLGSQRLQSFTRTATWTAGTILLFIIFALFTIVFTATFTTGNLSSSSSDLLIRTIPKTGLIFTLIIPYVLSWLLGILACVNILKYAREVNGIIYRSALRWLVLGIFSVLLFGILIQVLTLVGRFFTGLSLAPILATLYIIVVLYGAGFWFIQAGTRRLAKLEVVE